MIIPFLLGDFKEEYQMFSNLTLRIDVASIPDFRRVELAKGALALTEQVFSMPGAEERYQRWKSERVKKAANANSTSETGVLA